MFARKLISLSPRSDRFIKHSKTFGVVLPQMACAFVRGLSEEEIIVFVLPLEDDA